MPPYKSRRPRSGDLIFRSADRQPVYYKSRGARPGTIIVAAITRPHENMDGGQIDEYEWMDGSKLTTRKEKESR